MAALPSNGKVCQRSVRARMDVPQPGWKMRYIIPILILLATAGCHSAEKAAEYAIKEDLGDPASAIFRGFRINHEGVVCGEVNAKDRSGTLTGFRQFIFYSHTGDSRVAPVDMDKAFENAEFRCRTSLGSDQKACAAKQALNDTHNALADFRTRYGIDCH